MPSRPSTSRSPARRASPAVVALAAAGLALVAPACRSTPPEGSVQARILDVVDDLERRAALLEVVRARESAQALFFQQRTNLEQRFKASNADPRASEPQLRAVADAFEREYAIYRSAVLEAAVAMRELTTPEEWAAIAEVDLAEVLDSVTGRL
jgi:hypothetical protein